MSSPTEKRNLLFETASAQFGLFTAKQAVEAGYTRKHFQKLVSAGEWSQELWGLHRLINFPVSPEQEYMKWLLWSRNRRDQVQGCLSHETALYIYKLGDIMPNRIHMTVPRDFRRSDIPNLLQIHKENLGSKSFQIENGLSVTTPVKTFEDLLHEGRTDKSILEESLSRALEFGMITAKQLSENKALQNLKK
jgi:predicted transcriptional regulator of viral defense system